MVSDRDVLELAGCESIEKIVRGRRLCSGYIFRRVVFGELTTTGEAASNGGRRGEGGAQEAREAMDDMDQIRGARGHRRLEEGS